MMSVIPSPTATACFGVMPSTQLSGSDFLPLSCIIAPILVHKGVYVLRNFDLEAKPCSLPRFSSPTARCQDWALFHLVSSKVC